MGKRLVITEKPSVARDIAAALGGFAEDDECLESEDFVDHLGRRSPARARRARRLRPEVYRSWSIKNLPILPDRLPDQAARRPEETARQDQEARAAARTSTGLVNACDAGREGELIYRRIVEYCELDGHAAGAAVAPVDDASSRSATRSTTSVPGQDLDPLADAAWLRSVGDWLVGMNATRALTQRLKSRGEREAWSAGRVQTPTLVHPRGPRARDPGPRPAGRTGRSSPRSSTTRATATRGRPGTGIPSARKRPKARRTKATARRTAIFDRAEVDRLSQALEREDPRRGVREAQEVEAGAAAAVRPHVAPARGEPAVLDVGAAHARRGAAAVRGAQGADLPAYRQPLPARATTVRWSTTLLQSLVRHEARLGEIARHRRHGRARPGRRTCRQHPRPDARSATTSRSCPPGNPVPPLSGDDERVFDLVVRQFVAALMGPATWAPSSGSSRSRRKDGRPGSAPPPGSLEVPGFLEALGQQRGLRRPRCRRCVPGQDDASRRRRRRSRTSRSRTRRPRPPGRYYEAQLLRMMETAGERVDDEELSDAMKERGLGTPATRADTIERLVSTDLRPPRRRASSCRPARRCA